MFKTSKKKREQVKKYRENNPEKVKEYKKEYREKNKDKIREYNYRYKKNNPEKVAQWQKKYRINNPEKIKKARKTARKTDTHKFYRYEYSARKRRYIFDLSKEQFSELINSPCHYCGYSDGKVGVDRKDNDEGYTVKNSVSCCKNCNFLKGTLDYESFILTCCKIANNITEN